VTTPDGTYPDGTITNGDLSPLNGLDQATWRANLNARALSPWTDAQAIWHGKFDSYDAQLLNFYDTQLDMLDRVDLLEGVSGYCNVFMSANWVVGTGGAAMPFDTQIGPKVVAIADEHFGIHIPGDNTGVGLWRSDLQVTFASPGSTVVSIVRLVVFDKDAATEYTRRSYNAVVTPYGAQAASFSSTFVLPENTNGYDVYCVIVPSAAIKVLGGTVLSALTVNRWSSGIGVLANEDSVPDGGTL
jgi:hypothetical protein